MPTISCSMAVTWLDAMDSKLPSRRFPGFDHVFDLTDPGSERAFVASIDIPADAALPMLRGELRRITPIEGRWALGGRKPSDVVWTTLALPVLMHQKVVDLLRNEGFTGWDSVPCNLHSPDGESWPYAFLTVRGRCGAIDDRKSVQFDKQYPEGIFPAWKGLYFDPDSWDGSDVFMPTGDVGWIFVSERAKSALDKARVSNISCTPLDKVERVQIRKNASTG